MLIIVMSFYRFLLHYTDSAVAACDLVEKRCPDATCKAETRMNGLAIMCVCNTDLCNSNITWTSESDESHHSNSLFGGRTIIQFKILVILDLPRNLQSAQGFFFTSQEMFKTRNTSCTLRSLSTQTLGGAMLIKWSAICTKPKSTLLDSLWIDVGAKTQRILQR